MWNLRHAPVSTYTDTGIDARSSSLATTALRAPRARGLRRILPVALVVISLLTLLPIACALYTITAPSAGFLRSLMNNQPCSQGADGCDDDSGTPPGPSHNVDTGTPLPPPPPCEELCARIKATYHDSRTQSLLLPLAQTPTGRGAVEYLLVMADRLGDEFITWSDLGKTAGAGQNNPGGYITLNTAMLTRDDLGPYFLSGTLLHEAIESYFDIAEGIRDMGTRHADYVAQWFNGKFERELHALPYYTATDPFYLPSENSAYGLSYVSWLQTDDGRLYLGNPEAPDLRHVDRRGHAWAPSDWWAQRGGFWVLGQGTDVTPVPHSLGLTTDMLIADDLSAFAA